jgi:hypothetical protein
MRKVFLTLFFIAGLLFLPSCSQSNCEDVESTLTKLDSEYVAEYNIAKTRVQNSETWVPVIKKGLDLTNYALNESTCIDGAARAQWQTMKQTLSLQLESWIK